MISILDWVYPIGNKAKAYSVREVIGDKLALTAPIILVYTWECPKLKR